MNYILNAQGKVVPEPDVLTWARWFERADRRVGRSFVGKVEISTVFLGLDYGWNEGPPVVWESMAFDTDFNELACDRCAGTREQAEAMHALMVRRFEKLDASFPPPPSSSATS